MNLQINDKIYQVQADGETPLLWVLRDELGLTGTKYGCGLAQCGACSVVIDGAVTRSCVTPIDGLAGRRITTIEAIETDPVGKRVVAAWIRHQVPQCGYCQSGQVMAATALLKQTPHPTDDEITSAMVNLCRCGTYNAIRAAVHDLSGDKRGQIAAAAGLPADRSGHPASKTTVAATIALAGIGAIGATAHDGVREGEER